MKKTVITALLAAFAAVFLSSCAIFDYPARFLGYSTAKFRSDDAAKISQNFDMTAQEAFDKTLEIITKMHARVTHQSVSGGYIVAFDFSKSFDYCLDSTEAAFFFEQAGDALKVTVVSNNSVLTAELAAKYFRALGGDYSVFQVQTSTGTNASTGTVTSPNINIPLPSRVVPDTGTSPDDEEKTRIVV